MILIAVGFLFVGIGALGVVLPVLPTTPFLLVAAACFARSSERFYTWLLNLRVFGGMIKAWEISRSIPRKAKFLAIAAVVLVGGCSILFFIDSISLKLLVTGLLALNIVLLTKIPSTETLGLAPVRDTD